MQLSETSSAKKAVSKTVISLKKSAKGLSPDTKNQSILDLNLDLKNNKNEAKEISFDIKPVTKKTTVSSKKSNSREVDQESSEILEKNPDQQYEANLKAKKEIVVSKTRNVIKNSDKTLSKKSGYIDEDTDNSDMKIPNKDIREGEIQHSIERSEKNKKSDKNKDRESDSVSKKSHNNPSDFQDIIKPKKSLKNINIDQKLPNQTISKSVDSKGFIITLKDLTVLWVKKIAENTKQFYNNYLPSIGSTCLFFICLSFFLSIDSGQFFGIEINRYQTTLASLGGYLMFLNLFLIDSRFSNKYRLFVNFQSGILVVFSFLYFIRSGNINFLIPDFINNYVVDTLKINSFRYFSSSLIFMPLCFLIFIHNFYLYSKIKLPLIFTLIKIFIISLYTFYFLNFLEQDRTPDRDFNNFVYEFVFSLNDNILIAIFALIISLTTYLNLKIKKTTANAGLIMLFLVLNFQLIWALNILKINSFSNFGYWHKSLVFMIVWDFGFAEVFRKTTKAKDTERLNIKSNLSLAYHLILIAIVMITSVG